jgi:hypothetical protein
MCVMTESRSQGHEERAIGQVRQRLQARFSERSRTDVAEIVDRVALGFVSARIRDYVPLLVERVSRDELNRRVVTR